MVLRANARGAVHDEAAGHIFQFFSHIFTQTAQLAAAIGAGRVAGGQFDLHAWNMVRDRPALRLVGGCILWQTQLCGHCGDGDLAHLQGQLQLLGGLRRGPEAMGTMARPLVPQLLDQNGLRLHFGQQKGGECPQFRRVFRQRFGDIQHDETIAKQGVCGNPKTAKRSIYPAVKGRQVRCGNRQSIPSSSIANCAGVSAILPSLAEGHTNRPFSNRFENRQAP